MSMMCPACQGELAPIDTQGHYGTRLTVDSCLQCLGFWLEAIEPASIGHAAVTDLEGDANLNDIVTQPRSDFRGCPQCRVALEEITGGNVPEGLHVDTCPQCHGMWFDRGELLVYKSVLEQKRKAQNETDLTSLAKQRKAPWLNSRHGNRMVSPIAEALSLLM